MWKAVWFVGVNLKVCLREPIFPTGVEASSTHEKVPAVPLPFEIGKSEPSVRPNCAVKFVGQFTVGFVRVSASQFAVTVTFAAGIVNVVIGLVELARVTPPELTVQFRKINPSRVPALIVTRRFAGKFVPAPFKGAGAL
jgi:hypothetical protein